MSKTNISCRVLLFVLLSFFMNCSSTYESACNDCIELTTKRIQYLDTEGRNLLFGNNAIYNPEDIEITNNNNQPVEVWLLEDSGSVAFDLDGNTTSYVIVLSDILADNLEFELDERPSESCCGNVVFSTKTILNNQEIENNDTIVIIN